ncbi:serine protease inhibitor 3/4-like isoform X3 [Cylas formicarius]|uniref:serine protease inhibitor 3/4-like isoform X3 n=1 Tax=Cylas formicarius TaxID=197179 RepID=UPI0029585A5B|nr:serine protease inhibitor 3/4-like isoform X3 [Cylas formicarius]
MKLIDSGAFFYCGWRNKTKKTAYSIEFIFTIFTALSVTTLTMANKQELQSVIQGNSLFTKELYSILSKTEGNVFFSPISVHAILSLAFQGAKGATKEAFAKSLNVVDSDVAATGYKDILAHLNNISDVQLLMANKVYVKQGRNLKQSFKDVTEKHFLAEVEAVDFVQSKEAAEKINSWVEHKTNNKIKDLINPGDLDALTRLILVNAIYFKGMWLNKFNPERTQTEKFYLNENDTVDVQMMFNKDKYLFKEDSKLDAKILEMPYSNQDVSLVIILPNKRDGIAELEQKLFDTDLTKITENMFKVDVIVKLPKFKIEHTIQLNEPLSKAGLDIIFGDQADFSELLEGDEALQVSKVVQKAFIEVNEEGTEAAAATGVKMRMKRAISCRDFSADRTFIFMLCVRHKGVQNILFYGRLAIPNPNRASFNHDEL